MKLKAIMAMAALTTTLQAANPFMKPFRTEHGTYPFEQIRTEHYMPAFREAMRQQDKEIQKIVSNRQQPTFQNTIEALEHSGQMLSLVEGAFFNLTHADTNEELQKIELEVSPLLSEHSNRIMLNEALFARIKAVYEQRDRLNLTPEQQKLLKDTYDSFADNGANLTPEQKKLYDQLSTQLTQLTLTFGQNALKATNAWTKLITDESLLEGLSDDTRQMLLENAQQAGQKGWLITLKPTSVFPILKSAANRELRREVWTANNTKCIGGDFDNTDIIREIVNTRLKIARLLGHKTYADYVLRKRMAGNTHNVYRLLDQLRDAYMPAALGELSELQAYAERNGLKGQLMPWDWSYYSEKLKNERYSLDDEVLRPYFELEHVKKGVFWLAGKLYGLHFEKNDRIQVYNKEVEAFDVTDSDGKYMGVLYTDFHPRDGKRGGAWMNNMQEQYVIGGIDHRPHIVIVMNFTRPTANKPALLTYDEVETFLHEFGHSLHGMLSKCQYVSQSGTNTYRDFVEMPSQFNENFLTERQFLDSFAVHYQTGQPMPDEYIRKIREARNYHAAYACVRQLSFGYLDMAWHTLSEPFGGGQAEMMAFEHEAMKPVQLLPVQPNTAMEYAFTHIFSGGYAAGYYGYKWAEVLDADAFSVFQQEGIFNKATADRFRSCILERGSTRLPDELYRDFRGTDASVDALIRRDGIMH